ncbi:MAG: PocR ligand-binding domain-containing protein [Syntrophomonas sp.]
MEDSDKTKEQLITELAELRLKIQELEVPQKDPSLIPLVAEPSSSDRVSTDRHDFVPENCGYQQPDKNSRKYHISELIDMPLLQQLFDSFFELTGIMYALLDVDTNILSRSGWTDICLNFHRACPQTECRCKRSDCYINDCLQDGPYIKYKCANGLIEYATPIIVEGQHLATIYMGQLFNEPPDEDFFRQQAQEFGFDETAYLEAVHKVCIIPEHRIKPIMEFYSKLGQVMASMGLERLQRIEAADQVIREREERLRMVLEGSNDGFWDWNTETGEIYLSSRWSEMLGYSPEEIKLDINMWKKLIHPEDVHHTWKTLNEHMDGRSDKYEDEHRMLTKSGEWKWIMDRGQVVTRNKVNQPLRIAGTMSDITNRKEAEMALILSEECFSKAFNASPVLMTITTLEEGRYIKANNAFQRTTGYSHEEVIGQSSLQLGFWPNTADRYVIKRRIMANQSVEDMEIRFCTSTGEQRTGLFSARRLDVHGEVCMLSVLMDITELRKMEAEMTRLDRLNVVGEMAASIGHEIRNPMTTVRGYLQFLRENEDYSQEIECFDLMIEELDRANSIITEFLSLAKDKIVELKLTSLNAIINKLLPLVQAKAMSRDQQIRLELGDLPDLHLDIKEIRQLILNLVNNGMESMPSAGVVTIKTFMEKEIVVLAIQDQGHGIDHELLDKLGTPFLTTKDQGTGLGLAVCYRIATRHNAAINIETTSNGTTFFVRFPIQ